MLPSFIALKIKVFISAKKKKKQEKYSNQQPNIIPKTTRKIRTKKNTKLIEEKNHKDQSRNKLKQMKQ